MSMINGENKSTNIIDVDATSNYINNALQNKIKDKYSKPDSRINILSVEEA